MSDSTNNATIKVGVDATGVEVGMRKIDEAASKTARNLENLGRGDGFNRLGDGAEASAGKIDRSTKSLADSIQRATAAMQSGAKGSAEYYAALANTRGLNVAALKPYLDQLDQVTKQTKLAAEAQKKLSDGENFIASLKAKADAIGKTASQLLEMRAAELGVADAARPMIDRLRESEDAAGGFGSALGGVKGVLGGLAAALSVGALTSWVKGAIDAADGLKDLSKSTAVSVENLAGLRLASKQTGAELEGTAAAINKLSVNIGKDSEKFAKLGITAKEPLEAFKQLADVFSAIEDPQQRAAFGAAALGKSWAEAAPLLSEGSVKIGEMIERGQSLSGITTQLADDADDFNDVLAELTTSADAVSTKLAISLLPILKAMSEDMAGASSQANSLSGILVTGLAEAFRAITVFGGNVAFVLKGVGNEIGGVAAQIAALATLDFEGFTRIGELMKQEAEDGRKAFDEWEKKILDAGKNVENAAGKAGEAAANAVGSDKMKELTALIDEFNGAVDDAGKKAEEAARKSEAAAKREADAYAGLTSSIRERIAATAAEAAGRAPLTESQKLQVTLTEKLASGQLTLTAAHKASYEQLIKELRVNEGAIAGRKALAEADKAYQKTQKDAADIVDRKIADLTREAEANEALAQNFGKSKTQIEALTLARLEDQLAQRASNELTLDQIEVLEKEIAQRKRNVAALGSIDTQEASKKANEAMAADWAKTVETYEDVFRTGFADMLNNGKEGWRSFTKSLTTTFKTAVADQIYKMLAQPFVVKIIASLAGVAGQGVTVGAQAATAAGTLDSVGGVASMASAAYKAISLGFSGLSTVVADTVQGVLYQSGLSTQILSNGAFATSAGAVAGYAGGAAIGIYGGRAISGGYGMFSGSGNTAVNAGTVIGAIVGGPIGAAIGGLIGGAANRLFGMKAKEITSTTLNGNFSANGFSGTTDSAFFQKGGIFRSDKSGVDKEAIDTATALALSSGYEAVKNASADFAAVLGINADSIKNRAQSLSIALSKDNAENEKALAQFFISVGDQIATELVPNLAAVTKAGESAGAALQRVAGNYAFIDTALAAMGKTFGSVGVESIAARERLVDLAGGLESFGKGAAFFAQNFLSESERLAPVAASVSTALEALGLAFVDTRDEFKNVVLGLDLTTAQGAATYAELMKVQEAFALLHPVVEGTSNAAQEAAKALADINKGYQNQIDDLIKSTLPLAEQRAMEIRGMDETTVALYDRLAALKLERAASEKAAEQAAEVVKKAQDAAAASARASAEIFQSIGDGLASTMAAAKEAAKSLRDFNTSLLLGSSSPLDARSKRDLAAQQFAQAAPEQKQAAANAFLSASSELRQSGGSAFEFAKDFAQVQLGISRAADAQDRIAASIPEFYKTLQARATVTTAPTAISAPAVAMRTSSASRAQAAEPKEADALRAEMLELRTDLANALKAIAESTASTASSLDDIASGRKAITTEPA